MKPTNVAVRYPYRQMSLKVPDTPGRMLVKLIMGVAEDGADFEAEQTKWILSWPKSPKKRKKVCERSFLLSRMTKSASELQRFNYIR